MANNDNIKEVGLRFTADGDVDFKKSLSAIKNEMNLASAEYQKAVSEMNKYGDAIEYLKEKQGLYNKQVDLQKEKIETLRMEITELSKDEGKNADEIAKKKAELARAEAQLNKYEKSLKDVNSKLNEAYQEHQKLEKELKNIETELTQAKADFELEMSALKKNATETEKLTAKKKLLEKQTELQQKKVEDLQRQLDIETNSEEKNEEAIASKKLELTRAETELNKYQAELKETTNELGKHSIATDKLQTNLANVGTKCTELGRKLSIISAAIAGLIGKAISVGMQFDDSMKQVAATMGITASEIENGSKSYEILENAAKECGKTTKYSASEAAEALNYLALAGYDAEKSAKVLPKVLNLAAAGNLDLATASDMVTDAMAALGLETQDLDRYIDEMAKTSQKSNTSVSQLGEATLTCAGTVSMAGMSLETMNTELGILANNGIKGAEGGTHLRNIILSLTSPTDSAAKAIKNLGINVTDSKGNIRDLNDIMQDFNKKLNGMSDAKKTDIISSIFNKTDISAVNALIKGSGDEFANLNNEVKNANGSAKDMADTMNSSLKGKMTLIKSQIEGIAINITDKLAPTLEKLFEKISSALTWFSNLSDSAQGIILMVGLIIVALGPLLIIIGAIATGISSLIGLVGAISTPILVVIGVITALIAIFTYLWNTNEEFRNNVVELWSSIQAFFTAFLNWLGGVFGAGFDEKFGFLKEIVSNFHEFISSFMNSVITLFKGILDFLTGVFTGDWDLAFSGLENILNGWFGIVDSIFSFVRNIFNTFLTWLAGVFLTDWSKYFGRFGDIANGFSVTISGIITAIRKIFTGLIDFITGIFTGNWQKAWQGIVNIFSGIVGGLGTIIKSPLNAVIGLINSAITGINGISVNIPNWVPGFGGKTFGMNIPKIPYLKVGIANVPYDNYLAYLHQGERVLTKEQNRQYNKDKNEEKEKVINYNLTLNIDKVNNSSDRDIKTLARELQYYLKKLEEAKG